MMRWTTNIINKKIQNKTSLHKIKNKVHNVLEKNFGFIFPVWFVKFI